MGEWNLMGFLSIDSIGICSEEGGVNSAAKFRTLNALGSNHQVGTINFTYSEHCISPCFDLELE